MQISLIGVYTNIHPKAWGWDDGNHEENIIVTPYPLMSTAWHLSVLDGGIVIKKETEREWQVIHVKQS